VLGKAFKIASLACLVGLSLLYPFIELLDRWDAPGPSSDSEIQIIVLLTFVGIMILMGHLHASLTVSASADVLPELHSRAHKPVHSLFLPLHPTTTASPPLRLRI
jgi:formate hydrogenlyase subunit 3/multisubunit Na+/H+ antiporter MnhD subunit